MPRLKLKRRNPTPLPIVKQNLGDSSINEFTDQNDKLADFAVESQRLSVGKGIPGLDPWSTDLPLFNNYWTEWVQSQC
ncbi:uncharacterized protein F4817DRAFT_330654 [Daldinia loculata]|uniref:uncharacterized protein n=1 Tax=Daldinia loculata TaxID=103429 RepID=UPI0020C357DA|nr:uncharacterized protein F4817DRAFT_330654 [Daldinia loculata]KAI1649535.1 hypothetical protein F4817DRAFT_330654 [Daldinia loculata]